MIRKLILIFGIITGTISSYGQIPVIETPKAATFQNYTNFGMPQNNGNVMPNYMQNEQLRIQQQNKQIMREYQQHQRMLQQQNEIINDAANTFTGSGINYSFPSNSNLQGKGAYKTAFNEFQKMLNGEQELSIKRAVFISENAYYENTLPYDKFEQVIDNIELLCNYQMRKSRLPNNDLAKNLAIYQFFADTIEMPQPHKEQTFTHYPLKYDFKDYRGDTIWENQFVTKLLYTQSGQCHSMPLLYLTIAEEMNTKAWLVYSPKHTFVRFQTGQNTFQNFETTNGMLTSNAFVLQSGYIKAEALANKIYMDTLSKQQTVAHCLLDLAKGYERKYGFDEFYLQCVNLALENHPNNITGQMMKSNYYNALWAYVRSQQQQLGGIPKTDLKITKELYQNAKGSYDYVRELGYEDMPEEVYRNWLQSVNQEQSKDNYNLIQKSLNQINR